MGITSRLHNQYSHYDKYGHTSEPTPPAYIASFVPIFVVYMIYVLTSYAAYIYRALYLRDNSLLERSVFLISIHTISGIVFVVNVCAHSISANYPCFIDMWLLVGSYTMWMATFILFMIRYYVAVRFQYAMAQQARKNPVTPENLIEHLAKLQSASHRLVWSESSALRRLSDAFANSLNNEASVAEAVASNGQTHHANESRTWLDQQPPLQTGPTKTPTQTPNNELKTNTEFTKLGGITNTSNIIPPSPCALSDIISVSMESGLSQESLHDIDSKLDLSMRKKRQEKWTKLFLNKQFYYYSTAAIALVTVGYLALLSTLFTRLKLGRIYYNCFSGLEFLPHVITSGIFNAILGPLYAIVIWKYQDAYGIKTSLCISFAFGVLIWAGVLTWRLTPSWRDPHISASILYFGQISFTHALFVVIPLIQSIKYSRLRNKGLTNSKTGSANVGNTLRIISTRLSDNKDTGRSAFMAALNNTEEHKKIWQFAESCFCTEMITFLDVYQAFKMCAFREACRDSGAAQSIASDQESVVLSHAAPTITVTESNPVNSEAPASQTPNTSNLACTSIHSLKVGNSTPKQRNSEIGRLSRLLGHHKLPSIFGGSSARGGGGSNSSSLHHKKHANRRSAQTYQDIQSLSIGIVDMLKRAFPELDNVDSPILVPDSLRDKLSAIFKTFILPGSAFELNIDAHIVNAAAIYVEGAQIPYEKIDHIKDEIIDMLHTNVYVRYIQSKTN